MHNTKPNPPSRGEVSSSRTDTFHYRSLPSKEGEMSNVSQSAASAGKLPQQGGMAHAALFTSLASLAGANKKLSKTSKSSESPSSITPPTDGATPTGTNALSMAKKSKPNRILLGNTKESDRDAGPVSTSYEILSLVNGYFSERECERIARREAFSRQTKMMLGSDQDEGPPRQRSPNSDESERNRNPQKSDLDEYLTLDTHQQRIVLQTNFRRRAINNGAGDSGDRTRHIYIPVTSDEPPEDPFATVSPVTFEDDKVSKGKQAIATMPSIFAQAKKQTYKELRRSVRGFFDDLDNVDDQRQLLWGPWLVAKKWPRVVA